ncbi:MAG: HTH domain-containing protein, partial [Oscillospiraceae bacterium]|nr:HTH domain-containing protein [Oscillospiraceae bacterium]
MNATERRGRILEYLREWDRPLSATALARRLSVSRQVIVGDVALLRAAGEGITATPRGYVLDRPRA